MYGRILQAKMLLSVVIILLGSAVVCQGGSGPEDRSDTYSPAETYRGSPSLQSRQDCFFQGGKMPNWSEGCWHQWVRIIDFKNCWPNGGGSIRSIGPLTGNQCWPANLSKQEFLPALGHYRSDCLIRCPPNKPIDESFEEELQAAQGPTAMEPLRTEPEYKKVVHQYIANTPINLMSNVVQSSSSRENWFGDQKNALILMGWSPSDEQNKFVVFVLIDARFDEASVTRSGCESPTTPIKVLFSDPTADFRIQTFICKGESYQFSWEWERKTTLNIDLANAGCGHNKMVWQQQLEIEAKGPNNDAFLLCANRTLKKTVVRLSGIRDCSLVYVNKKMTACKVDPLPPVCAISVRSSNNGKFQMTADVMPGGPVTVHSDEEDMRFDCSMGCNFEIAAKKTVVMVCPSGQSTRFRVTKDMVEDCPFISIVLASKISAYVCRMTFRPSYFWALMFWLVMGLPIVVIGFTILSKLMSWALLSVSWCSRKVSENVEICASCNQYIDFETMKRLHDRCPDGVCPYCRITFDPDELAKHCANCGEKLRMIKSCRHEMKEKTKQKDLVVQEAAETLKVFTKSNFQRSIYGIIASWLLLMVLLPTASAQFSGKPIELQDTNLGYNDELTSSLLDCNPGCWWVDEVCVCGSNNRLRRLLSDPNTPIRPPKGFFYPQQTFMIAASSKTLDMTIGSSETVGNKVRISGSSITSMPIEEHSGIVWDIGSPDAKEKRSISVGILEAYQEYEAVFRYYSADRSVKNSMEMECTGSCSNDCNCKSTTCKKRLYPDDRSWSCNPGWCLSINNGCTCCTVSAAPKEGRLFSYWDLEYRSTKITICVKMDDNKFVCTTVDENSAFHIENLDIKITRVFGVDKKLPKKVVAVHDMKNHIANLAHPLYLLLDPELCDRQSCKHGEIGDYSFTSLDFLTDHEKEAASDLRMSWTGLSIGRQCYFAKDPSCTYESVVENLETMFENKIKVTKHARDSFIIKELTVQSHSGKVPELRVKVLPKYGYGNTELMLRAKGIELTKKEVKVVINTFLLKSCAGCRGCEHGFTCVIAISLSEPATYTVHLTSPDPSVAVDTGSLEATQDLKLFNVSLFTGAIVSDVKICLQESDQCTKVGVNLSEPVLTMLPAHENVIHTANSEADLTWAQRAWQSITSFFTGIWDVISGVFSNWKLLLIVLAVLLLIILLTCTPIRKIFRLCVPRRLRSTKYKREVKYAPLATHKSI